MKYTKIVYVAHPYLNKEENKQEVEHILIELQEKYPDYLFISPIHCFGWAYNKYDYSYGMNMCLGLLDKCDILLLCGDWQTSRGCDIEKRYAIQTDNIEEVIEYTSNVML